MTLGWTGPSGTHQFRVVQRAEQLTTMTDAAEAAPNRVDDFTPLHAGGIRRIAATTHDSALAVDERRQFTPGSSSIEAGVLVHRALEAGVVSNLERLLRDDERALIDDLSEFVDRATAALSALRGHPEIREIFGPSTSVVWRRHEVPFSWRRDDATIVRGTIDCVVKRTSGVIQILEFKTGRRAAEHERQLDVYLAAARALFPDEPVEGLLIYPENTEQLSIGPGV